MLEFVEQHNTGGVAYIRISEEQAIEYMKALRPYPNDEEALLDFIAVHWAYQEKNHDI